MYRTAAEDDGVKRVLMVWYDMSRFCCSCCCVCWLEAIVIPPPPARNDVLARPAYIRFVCMYSRYWWNALLRFSSVVLDLRFAPSLSQTATMVVFTLCIIHTYVTYIICLRPEARPIINLEHRGMSGDLSTAIKTPRGVRLIFVSVVHSPEYTHASLPRGPLAVTNNSNSSNNECCQHECHRFSCGRTPGGGQNNGRQ